MPYINFTEQEKELANASSIVDYLTSHGEKVERAGREYVWEAPSGKVSINGSEWFSQYELVAVGVSSFKVHGVILSDLHSQFYICGCFGGAVLLGRYRFSTVESLEIFIPILVLRCYTPHLIISKCVDRVSHSFASQMPSAIIIKA